MHALGEIIVIVTLIIILPWWVIALFIGIALSQSNDKSRPSND